MVQWYNSRQSPSHSVSFRASLMAQMVKNLPVMLEIQFESPVQKDPLEEEMETQSSILSCDNPWIEEPGEL